MGEITNEEYEKALNNHDNMMIMNSVGSRFLQTLDEDEIHRCKLMALWEALKTWKPERGRKFTAFLYQRVYWECLKSIAYNNKHRTIQIPHIEQCVSPKTSMYELLDGFPHDLQDMLEKRCVHKMTLREIGDEYGCCYETIRKKLKKASKYIQNGV